TATPRIVTVCAPARPTWRPNSPATMEPSSGASTMASSTDLEMAISMPGMRSTLQRVDLGDVDRAPVAEQGDQDGQADRGLRRGHGQDEEHEDLPGGIAELAREGDEIDVHREQQQLDAHQQDDHVLPVQEDAGDADAEQHRAKQEVMAEGQALREQLHQLAPPSAAPASPAGASTAGFSAGMLTIRIRS